MKVVIYKKSSTGKLRRIASQKDDIAIVVLSDGDKSLIKRMREDSHVYSYLESYRKFDTLENAQAELYRIVTIESEMERRRQK